MEGSKNQRERELWCLTALSTIVQLYHGIKHKNQICLPVMKSKRVSGKKKIRNCCPKCNSPIYIHVLL